MTTDNNDIDPKTSVEIAGAGPAGLAVAITLAHAGRKVIVHEAYKEVGHRFDGDFQDTLWGFGMRLAISSGVLAAQSLLNGEDYDTLWQRELKPLMETSVVNRALYSMVGNRGYSWCLRLQISRPNLRESLRRQYQPSLLKRLLEPWAQRRYTSLRKDVSCNHIDCHCIWCRGECCIHD